MSKRSEDKQTDMPLPGEYYRYLHRCFWLHPEGVSPHRQLEIWGPQAGDYILFMYEFYNMVSFLTKRREKFPELSDISDYMDVPNKPNWITSQGWTFRKTGKSIRLIPKVSKK